MQKLVSPVLQDSSGYPILPVSASGADLPLYSGSELSTTEGHLHTAGVCTSDGQPDSANVCSNVTTISDEVGTFQLIDNHSISTAAVSKAADGSIATVSSSLPSIPVNATSVIESNTAITQVINTIADLPASQDGDAMFDSSLSLSLDPIVIKNAKTMSIARNNANMEIIVLPQISSQYKTILPKPDPPAPVPYHASISSTEPLLESQVYTFVKPSPQQEAQKFFGQMKRPYHQQLSKVEQFYLVRDSMKDSSSLPANASEQQNESHAKIKSDLIPENDKASTSESKGNNDLSQTFSSWDQKIRQSLADTDFKAPNPPKEVKSTRKSRQKKNSSQQRSKGDKKSTKDIPDKEAMVRKSRKKHKKSKKENSKELSDTSTSKSKKEKKRKKKKDKHKESSKKPHITPEFVNESLSSGTEEPNLDISNIRIRCPSESDTVMAETLLKTLNSSDPQIQNINPDNCSTPLPRSKPLQTLFIEDSHVTTKCTDDLMKPAFMEENANSSFDINKSSRPKPVVVPEGSHNSCSCHSNHQKEGFDVKNGGKSFSFKEQDNADSPKYYNESNSTITVATIFPSLSSSPTSQPSKVTDTQYRSPKLDEESDICEAEDKISDDEVRENTLKLPPVSSQNKDLLESSEDEEEEGYSKISEFNVNPPLMTPKKNLSLDLSESDYDSPAKQESLLSSKLKTGQLKASSTPIASLAESVNTILNDVTNKSARTSLQKSLLGIEGDVDLYSGNTTDVITESFQKHHTSDGEIDFNDSRDLVIDGDEIVKSDKNKRQTRRSTSSSKAHAKDMNADEKYIEDSCDVWYQNLPNKMEPKPSFSCGICGKKFPSLAVLTVHNETCSKIFLICTNCGKKCSSKSGLTLHKKSCLNPLNKSKSQPRSRKEKKPSSEISSVDTKTKIRISTDSSKSSSQKKSLKKKKVKLFCFIFLEKLLNYIILHIHIYRYWKTIL